MADVHGRLTGKAGVCLATPGPGATNFITGFADANMDRSPVAAIAGQGDTTFPGHKNNCKVSRPGTTNYHSLLADFIWRKHDKKVALVTYFADCHADQPLVYF